VIDVSHHISTLERRVGTRTLEAGEVRTVTISRVYDTEVDDLWDACTDPERISRWFLPVSGDLRLGGRYDLEGNASGTIERCEPPHRMDATWEFGGTVSWIELRLTSEPDGGTRLVLDHIAAVDDDMWARFGPGAVGIGWDGALLGLALHVEGGGAPARDEAQAWMASEEGRRFYALASERWAEASIAGGTDPEQARASQARVTDAYTGEPAT
jgi:uncharacterized protein YndB with AHSA1/START domain